MEQAAYSQVPPRRQIGSFNQNSYFREVDELENLFGRKLVRHISRSSYQEYFFGGPEYSQAPKNDGELRAPTGNRNR